MAKILNSRRHLLVGAAGSLLLSASAFAFYLRQAATTKKKTATKLRAGQFCSVSKESAYMAKGFTCVGGRLKKEGATSTTKTTSTKTTATTSAAGTKKYKAGQICVNNTATAKVYAAQGLKCVNGHLAKTK